MATIKLFTIGFTQKGAEAFFSALLTAGVRRLIDIRLNNVSQLAGFTKRDDLGYFLKVIGDIGYLHRPDLAPTQQMLDAFKKGRGDWSVFERAFLDLCQQREIEEQVSRDLLDQSCLLCSEATPDHCHRRLVAEYLQQRLGDIEICHL